MSRLFPPPRSSQRGAATLVVVMVLFLVMALLAAYANRSLMFEQRISGSYYRASLAEEMTEGGVEWTVAMLNAGAINGSCQPAATGGQRFADIYLSVSPADRSILPLSSAPTDLAADCVSQGTSLTCRCPAPDTRTTQGQTTVPGQLVPSFGVELGTSPVVQYGSFLVNVLGCTDSSVDNCAGNAQARSQGAMATAEQSTSIAFIAAVPSSPATPLTVKGTLTTSGSGGLGLHNTQAGTGGMLLVSGGPGTTAGLLSNRMDSSPGTPAAQSTVFDDSHLSGLTDTGFFQTHMGMSPSRYVNHPALQQVACPAGGDCGPALLAAYNAGYRMLWVAGPLQISTNVIIGTAASPVLIVSNGNLALSGPMQLTGMVVALGDLNWSNTGGLTSLVTGMVTVQGNMSTNGGMDIVYDANVANQLRNRVGSFARVSGGWRPGNGA